MQPEDLLKHPFPTDANTQLLFCSLSHSIILPRQLADREHGFIEFLQANLSTECLKLPVSTKKTTKWQRRICMVLMKTVKIH